MKLNKKAVELEMAKKGLTINDLSTLYGASKTRISAILNSNDVRPTTVNKLASALNCDLERIIE